MWAVQMEGAWTEISSGAMEYPESHSVLCYLNISGNDFHSLPVLVYQDRTVPSSRQVCLFLRVLNPVFKTCLADGRIMDGWQMDGPNIFSVSTYFADSGVLRNNQGRSIVFTLRGDKIFWTMDGMNFEIPHSYWSWWISNYFREHLWCNRFCYWSLEYKRGRISWGASYLVWETPIPTPRLTTGTKVVMFWTQREDQGRTQSSRGAYLSGCLSLVVPEVWFVRGKAGLLWRKIPLLFL